MNLARILSLIVNAPLVIDPVKLAVIYNFFAGREDLQALELPELDHTDAIKALRARPAMRAGFVGEPGWSGEAGKSQPEPFMMADGGVAIVPVHGEFVNRGAWVGPALSSGLSSYEGFKHQLSRAARNPKVNSILLDCESPGGEASGCFEAAAAVRALAEQKPVTAVVDGMALSGGYALASGAHKIVCTPSGHCGSIGVAMVHMDMSKLLENKGVTPTIIATPEHKVDGNPLQPLSDEVRADLQNRISAVYGDFVETVAAGRGRRISKAAIRETQGRVLRGREAVEAGLADDIGTFDDALASLSRKVKRNNTAKRGVVWKSA